MLFATNDSEIRQRRARRTALWLALLALTFYAAFIVVSVSRAHG